jgi:hypothetical protein
MLPIPAWPSVAVPGFAFNQAMNCGKSFAESEPLAVISTGVSLSNAIGVKSLLKSNLSA